MMLIRPVKTNDLAGIINLARLGGVGITTLPADEKILKSRIKLAVQSFAKEVKKPEHEYYLFVLEDVDTKTIVGTCAIDAAVGHETPFYAYKVSHITRISHELKIRNDYQTLSLVNDFQGKTELCTLFVDPKFRKNKNGLLLSLSRFLFIANERHRFSDTVFAEMRGISDEKGHSPFWDNIGAKFFNIEFAEADRLTALTNKQFIADLMPRTPIYATLLKKCAQKVIGKPHTHTQKAQKMLERQGLKYTGYVDVFDAGPTLETATDSILAIRKSRIKKTAIADSLSEDTPLYLVSTTHMPFYATFSPGIIEDETLYLPKAILQLLKIKSGEQVRIFGV